MIIAPEHAGPYDDCLKQALGGVKYSLTHKDDDWLQMTVGPTGSGKSSLVLHMYEAFCGDRARIEFVALSKEQFAQALKAMKELPLGERFVDYDELEASKREALTRWNRDMIHVYSKIRGLRCFHAWNNPSLDMIDKPFIEERVKGVIVVIDKAEPPRPRHYLYFTQRGILQLLEKHKNLKYATLKRYGPRYAYYLGWFRPYTGVLWEAYQRKKTGSMGEAVDEFYAAYGTGEKYSMSDAARRMGVGYKAMRKYLEAALTAGRIHPERKLPTGQWRVTGEDIEVVRMMMLEART